MKEQSIQRRITKALENRGCYVIKVITANHSGVPDLIVSMPQFNGQLWGIEVKRPGQKPRPIQSYNIDQINSSGGFAMVATSWEDVEVEIEKRLT